VTLIEKIYLTTFQAETSRRWEHSKHQSLSPDSEIVLQQHKILNMHLIPPHIVKKLVYTPVKTTRQFRRHFIHLSLRDIWTLGPWLLKLWKERNVG